MTLGEMFESFGRAIIFKRWREPLRDYLLKAGFEETPYSLFGVLFLFILGFTSLAFLGVLVPELRNYPPIVNAIASLLFFTIIPLFLVTLVCLGVYFVLNLRVYARVKEMEQLLPDYLQLVVTNLKSGMNFEQSLWAAARPEFGILSREIALVSKKVMTGNDTAEALMEFVNRYDSPTLRRNFNLIISEIQAGGQIVKVIERVIHSLKKTKDLKDELSASVLNFMIFIAVIVVILAPILFALANTLLNIMIGFAELLGNNVASSAGNLGSAGSFITKISSIAKSKDVLLDGFRTFSYWAVGIIAFFSSMIVSIIEKGDVKGGIRYVPLFTVSALVVFAIALKLLLTVFGGLVFG